MVLPGALLSQLLQLSRMMLTGSASCAGLNHLSCLTDMQHLELSLHGSTQAEEFAGMVWLDTSCWLRHIEYDMGFRYCPLSHLQAGQHNAAGNSVRIGAHILLIP